MDYSRRFLFKKTLIATAFSALPAPLLAATNQPLVIPPLLESRRGKPVFLGFESTQIRLVDNQLVEVWGFNGQYLGPTVRVRKGDFVKLNYRNNLPQAVAMNIQGLQTNSDILGGIGHSLKPQQSWSPIVPISQTAATCYYHSCSLASSAYQNYRGLVGMWIIEDDESRQAQLPNKYGVNDIPLILQDLHLNQEGAQLFQQNEPHFYGDRLFVNGQEAPFINVGRGWIRLRILNASVSRGYSLQFDDEREFLLIAKDQGFLPEAKTVKSVFVGTGERIEILVDLNEGGNVSLLAGKKRSFIDKVELFFNDNGELADNRVLELRPEGLLSVFNGKPSYRPSVTAAMPSQIAQERTFHFDTENAMINSKRFDPRRIDVNAKQGSVERWTLSAANAMGFRIQGAKFVVESRDDVATPGNELVWQDTLWFDKTAKILVKFDNSASNSQPFIFGSADLMQADKGALGLIVVQ
ncbi:multicopper oxidase domain-containing protein [Bisgaard Taxon 10/6]|uniref:multicopper oxidase domain-containing protein n=1 Tax=Exercitatus varius TaxID=67857 RepID=UPI0018A51B1F|nr:multicopper oxidase domain-containing protein [Exercitatus varius]QOF67869.1 multicopper oxidase domain-containing protein [Actinobacillus sp. GY-402]MDG2916052.1 multicopper oxidase domain-containing protein [Exercitatus varius]MDG2955693.1 multicopper oxidase domain-containing protein [Exercitatus varius]MDG2958169.1 multicopper oxidase domain-containing protein [Exercitatus varius]MDG2961431.1 multicopper oxidase domain-containing protein [Exercitatus varius]